MLYFRGALETLKGIIDAGSDCIRTKCLEKPAPPAWWENEVSTVPNTTAGCMNWLAGNVYLLLQSQRKESVQIELVYNGIDSFDLEREAHRAAEGFTPEGDGLTRSCRPFRITPLDPDVRPTRKTFPLYEVRPHHLDGRGDHRDRTDSQSHQYVPFRKSLAKSLST